MTKEPIMIDDVNVSECEEHYLNKYNEHMCCDYKTSDCSHCKPKQKQCYFYVESIENKLKHKEQECEELKIKNKEQKRQLRVRASILNTYKQALQKIKQIAEDECKNCTVKLLLEDEINCKRCYKTKILQKCEVIDARKKDYRTHTR